MCSFLFNISKTKAPWPQAMAALGRSAQRLEKDLDTFSTGEMGILVRPSPDQTAAMAQAELERALETSEFLRAQSYRIEVDSGGFPWVVVRGATLPELAAAAQAAGAALIRLGVGPRVIAGVFPFTWQDRRMYWLYQPRVNGFTPFAPFGTTEAEERDHPLEVRMASSMVKSIPIAKNFEDWYPVWDVPV